MINKLEELYCYTSDGNGMYRLPDARELVDKINEIVDYINKSEAEKINKITQEIMIEISRLNQTK